MRLPYRGKSFQIIIACQPIYQLSSLDQPAPDKKEGTFSLYAPPMLPIDEMMNKLSSAGYLIYGCPEAVWKANDMTNEIVARQEQHELDFLSLQTISLAIEDIEMLPPHKSAEFGEGMPASVSTMMKMDQREAKNREVPAIRYSLALLRRLA